MIDALNTQSIDITDIMNSAKLGNAITLFDTCVWEKGNRLKPYFHRLGFDDLII